MAEKITGSHGIIDGVEGHFLNRIGSAIHSIRVNAKLVIISAGSIGSTQVLMKIPSQKIRPERALLCTPHLLSLVISPLK